MPTTIYVDEPKATKTHCDTCGEPSYRPHLIQCQYAIDRSLPRASWGMVEVEQPKTLRDEFAMVALPSMVRRTPGLPLSHEAIDLWAEGAYFIADAMMKARNAN